MSKKSFPKKRRGVIKLAQKAQKDGKVKTIVEGGRHTKIIFRDGSQTQLWRHTGDIPTGTHASIYKMFVRAGIVSAIVCGWGWVIVNWHVYM